jgi:hypothetical protein
MDLKGLPKEDKTMLYFYLALTLTYGYMFYHKYKKLNN